MNKVGQMPQPWGKCPSCAGCAPALSSQSAWAAGGTVGIHIRPAGGRGEARLHCFAQPGALPADELERVAREIYKAILS